jgi:hypothetical protein
VRRFTVGKKNSSDSAVIIDYNGLALIKWVLSFLVILIFKISLLRLRESGMKVIGMGEKKTQFLSCDRFIYIEVWMVPFRKKQKNGQVLQKPKNQLEKRFEKPVEKPVENH